MDSVSGDVEFNPPRSSASTRRYVPSSSTRAGSSSSVHVEHQQDSVPRPLPLTLALALERSAGTAHSSAAFRAHPVQNARHHVSARLNCSTLYPPHFGSPDATTCRSRKLLRGAHERLGAVYVSVPSRQALASHPFAASQKARVLWDRMRDALITRDLA